MEKSRRYCQNHCGLIMSKQTLSVITSGAFAAALKLLAPMYEKKTGNTIQLSFGSSMGTAVDSIPTRLSQGEVFDVLVLAGPALDSFIKEGVITIGTKVDLAGSRMAAAVRTGDKIPNLSTLEGFKNTLLSTPRIAYSASASGTYLSEEVFPKIGVADQMTKAAKKIFGERVGTILMRNETDLGFQQYSELLPIDGIDIIRELPPEIQKTFYFTAGIGAKTTQLALAQELIAFLASQEVAPTIQETGLDAVLAPLPWK
jgi:molybdate transport system substrate-binding protein